MRREDFEAMYGLEESFWWYRAMRHITDTVVESELRRGEIRILDAGCGTSFNLQHFSTNHSPDVYGFDLAGDALEFIRRRGFNRICQASVTDIPFSSNTFDLAFSLDSLSHVPRSLQDHGLLELFRVLKPGGTLFIRVPAYEWMRSSHDQGMGNTRRYTRSELAEKLRLAGFSVSWASYANFWLFPVAVATRMLKSLGISGGSDVKPLPWPIAWMNPILRQILSSESIIFRLGGRLPFGLSVICRATKPVDAIRSSAEEAGDMFDYTLNVDVREESMDGKT